MSLKKIFNAEYQRVQKPVDEFDIDVVENIKAMINDLNTDPDFHASLNPRSLSYEGMTLEIQLETGFSTQVRLYYKVEQRNGRHIPEVKVSSYDPEDPCRQRDISQPFGRGKLIEDIIRCAARNQAEAERDRAKEQMVQRLFWKSL